MIWTEEEDDKRIMKNMLHPEDKCCKNCFFGGSFDESEWVTCGHHIVNLKNDSMCDYWTDPNDKSLKAYLKRKKKEFIKLINRKK